MLKRTANARWNGGLEGNGCVSTATSTVLNATYSFHSRFEEGNGTNPEELMAASHAACFTMALSFALDKAGHPAQYVTTEAKIFLDKINGEFKIKKVILTTEARVSNLSISKFTDLANHAKDNCPVSQALKGNVEIELVAKLAAD